MTNKTLAEMHFLRAKYDRAYEIGCDACGEVWAATDDTFKAAVLSISYAQEKRDEIACIACDCELEDMFSKVVN